MLKQTILLLTACCLFSVFALGQENRFDASISGMGVLGKVSSGNDVVQNVTNSFGLLATFRLRFNPHSSVAFNYGRTRDSQLYTTGGINYRIQGPVTEYSGVYMLNIFETARFQPFALVGVGALSFSPDSTFITTGTNNFGSQVPVESTKQTQFTTIIGAGLDYRLPWRFALRVQYRGLIYSAPDFKNQTLFTGAKGYYNEPSVGIVFKF
jgi:opacity protein-like surface antigen